MSKLDNLIAYFNPQKGLERAQAKQAIKVIASERKYDAVSRNERNTFSFLAGGNAIQESGQAFKKLSSIGSDLTRNNPLALRVVQLWANNAVGSGVKAQVSSLKQTKRASADAEKLSLIFNDFCASPNSTLSGNKSVYGIQREIVSDLVACGGIFVAKVITKSGDLKVQLIEQNRLSDLDIPAKKGNVVINGIEMTQDGEVKGYWFNPPNHSTSFDVTPSYISAENIYHVFDTDRSNQHVGVSWFSSVALTLDRYQTLMEAKIMQQQVAACFGLVVEEPDSQVGVGGDDRVDELEPALITYVKNGSVPHVINPPKADGTEKLEKAIKADVAIGTGLTYEMLTGDYSSTNFASGRMSRTEFAQGLSSVQHVVLEPLFNKIFEWYMQLHTAKTGIDTSQLKVDWAFPTMQAVNPVEEHDLLMSKVRHGMLSPSKACKMGGENFDTVIDQWQKDKAKMGTMPFDIDPSVYARTGNQLNTDDSASSNFNSKDKEKDNKDATEEEN